ncbi:MAG: RnfH family protein [Gammaproteobacteria bacterium]|nr:RnfH family protein [Gammaproteobacteria bacterium]
MTTEITIEVCYALPEKQYSYTLTVPEGTNVAAAIRQSGVLDECPEIDLDKNSIGIFSEACSPDDLVKPGDRIEIYRPLKIDPKEARRHRAMKRGG